MPMISAESGAARGLSGCKVIPGKWAAVQSPAAASLDQPFSPHGGGSLSLRECSLYSTIVTLRVIMGVDRTWVIPIYGSSMDVSFGDPSLDRLETDATFSAGFADSIVKAY